MKLAEEWQTDKSFSDRFLPEIRSILGMHLIAEPPREEDAERNTDLMVLGMTAVRIGCRIRKFEHLAKYGGEFTIRASRPSGAKTEMTKILEGWGDYFFYGFADESESRLVQWTLADMRVFRLQIMRWIFKRPAGEMPGLKRENKDQSSDFFAYRWVDFPPNFVVASFQCEAGN